MLFRRNIRVRESENSSMISDLKRQAYDFQYATSLMMTAAFILLAHINIFAVNVMRLMLLSIAKHWIQTVNQLLKENDLEFWSCWYQYRNSFHINLCKLIIKSSFNINLLTQLEYSISIFWFNSNTWFQHSNSVWY